MLKEKTKRRSLLSSPKVYISNKGEKKSKYEIPEDVINKAREKRILEKVKEIVINGEDLQNNYTPVEICDMMLDKLDLTQERSILVLYTIEILFALRKLNYKGQVTFFTQSLKKKAIAEKLLPGVIVEYIDIEENPLYHMENNWPEKFDIIVANPPYGDKRNTNLHFQFLEKSINISTDKVIFVHPSTPFISPRKLKSNIIKENIIENITIFNGNGIFGINKFFPLSITNISKNKTDINFNIIYKESGDLYKLDNFSKITHLGATPIISSIKEKLGLIETSLQSKMKHRKKNKINKKFIVPIAGIRGHVNPFGKMYKDDFFTLISKDTKIQSKESITSSLPYHWFEFDSEGEAKNFIAYCKTDFARFCISLLKFNNAINSSLHLTPYLNFTQEWSDKKLSKHFNISKEEQTFIKEIISPYYE